MEHNTPVIKKEDKEQSAKNKGFQAAKEPATPTKKTRTDNSNTPST